MMTLLAAGLTIFRSQFYVYMFIVYSVHSHGLVGDLHLLQIRATVLLFFTVPTLNKVFLLLLLFLLLQKYT